MQMKPSFMHDEIRSQKLTSPLRNCSRYMSQVQDKFYDSLRMKVGEVVGPDCEAICSLLIVPS